MSAQRNDPSHEAQAAAAPLPATGEVRSSMRQFARIAFAVLATLAGALLAWQFRSVLLLFVAALALAAAIGPAILWFAARGLRRGFATTLLVLLVVVGMLLAIGVSGYVLAEELPRAATDMQRQYAQVRNLLAEQSGWQGTLGNQLPAPEGLEGLVARTQLGPLEGATGPTTDAGAASAAGAESTVPAAETVSSLGAPADGAASAGAGDAGSATASTEQPVSTERRASGMLRLFVGTTSSVLGLFAQFIVLVFLSLYWSLERDWFERLWLSLLPAEKRSSARTAWHELDEGVGAHVRSEILQVVVAFILLYVGFSAMGLGYPMLMAWAAALSWMIPLLGWFVASVPIFVLALSAGPWYALGATLYMTLIFALLEFVIEPRLDIRRRTGSILGLIVTLLMLQAFGIVGLLIAGIVAVAIQILAIQWSRSRETTEPATHNTSVEQIEVHLAALRTAMGKVEGEIPLHTRSLYERLQTLMIEAEKAL